MQCRARSTTSGPPAPGIIAALAEADVKCWADKGYQGASGTVRVHVPPAEYEATHDLGG
jgi:hypothetical protein